MAVQKLANGWRARRKKDGKTFNGPLRATEVAANEDERQMEEAAAVSSERLQEVLGRLVGSLSAPAVQKLATGWRARRKKDGKTFNGPLRATEVAANEDARQMEEAAAVSSERLQEVFDRLSDSLSVPAVTSVPVVTQNGSNWRARVKVGRATVNGPTRQAKAAAEEDARLLQQAQQQAQQISNAEVHKVAERLQKDAADVRGAVTVAKHGVGWRARVKGAQAANGPTRSSKAAADVDASQLQAALQISAKELQSVAQRLQQEAADVVARSSREAHFDEAVLAEMRDAL